jgi:hypothetical protein
MNLKNIQDYSNLKKEYEIIKNNFENKKLKMYEKMNEIIKLYNRYYKKEIKIYMNSIYNINDENIEITNIFNDNNLEEKIIETKLIPLSFFNNIKKYKKIFEKETEIIDFEKNIEDIEMELRKLKREIEKKHYLTFNKLKKQIKKEIIDINLEQKKELKNNYLSDFKNLSNDMQEIIIKSNKQIKDKNEFLKNEEIRIKEVIENEYNQGNISKILFSNTQIEMINGNILLLKNSIKKIKEEIEENLKLKAIEKYEDKTKEIEDTKNNNEKIKEEKKIYIEKNESIESEISFF